MSTPTITGCCYTICCTTPCAYVTIGVVSCTVIGCCSAVTLHRRIFPTLNPPEIQEINESQGPIDPASAYIIVKDPSSTGENGSYTLGRRV